MKKLKRIKRKVLKKYGPSSTEGLLIKRADEVGINPVLRCNLNCVMCHQGDIKRLKDMPLDKFKKVLSNMKKSGVTKTSIIGGEIFVIPRIWDFISELEKSGLSYDLSSNLFYIPGIEKFKDLKGLEMVTTSIDGDQETHNQIRRNPEAFQNSVENIQKIVQMNIPIDVACVIQKANFEELERVTEKICRLGVTSMTFLIANKVTPTQKKRAEEEIKELTGADANFYVTTIDNPLGDLGEEEYKLFPLKLKNIRAIAEKYGVKLNLTTQLEHPEVLDPETSLEGYTCGTVNGYGSYVFQDGKVSMCSFEKLEGEKFDLSEHTLLDVLNTKEYQLIRKRFRDCGAFEKCRYCCALAKKK